MMFSFIYSLGFGQDESKLYSSFFFFFFFLLNHVLEVFIINQGQLLFFLSNLILFYQLVV